MLVLCIVVFLFFFGVSVREWSFLEEIEEKNIVNNFFSLMGNVSFLPLPPSLPPFPSSFLTFLPTYLPEPL